jgi:ABC-type nickel/cobalt efflux system permease component RcnA
MKKNFIIFISLLVIINFFIIGNLALAATADLNTSIIGQLGNTGVAAGYSANFTPLPEMIGKIIYIILSFLGIIFVVLTVYAGFLWMTAGGNEETVKKAKKWLENAVIGLVIILAAYAITSFVISQIIKSTTT